MGPIEFAPKNLTSNKAADASVRGGGESMARGRVRERRPIGEVW